MPYIVSGTYSERSWCHHGIIGSFVLQAFTSDFRKLKNYDISLSSEGLTFTEAPVKTSQLVWGARAHKGTKDRGHFSFISLMQVLKREEWNKNR
jgi:hypothetical protein